MKNQKGSGLALFMLAALFFVIFIAFAMWGLPLYSVYKKELYGQAELKQAEWNRQIIVQEAQAQEEAAVSWANSERIRAQGSADANEILQAQLGSPEAYLRWLYIDKLDLSKSQIIYLPTEASMPILEANRLNTN